MSDSPLRLLALVRDQTPRVLDAWLDLRAFLDEQPGVLVQRAELADPIDFQNVEADLVAVLGGDGAILRACRMMGTRQFPIIGVNLGRLGFLADLSPAEFREQFPEIRARRFRVAQHLMFECSVRRVDGTVESYLGLNEVALTSAVCLRMVDIEMRIDGERVTTYSCDGLIVSTPVGSTAHSLSAGGPILSQELRAFVITPICPHTLTNRPLVEQADRKFTLSVTRSPEGAIVVIDGQIRLPLLPGDVVEVKAALPSFQLVKIRDASYYTTLHRKLGWDGQPRYQS